MLPLKQFKDFIEQQQLFAAGSKILLAVSGGKDSVLMLHLFYEAGMDIGIAHCNFNLRGEESKRDEDFVRSLCNRLNLPFYITHFDTKKYAAANKISTQMAARDLRYDWFENIRTENGYDYIALAQHQNDAVETILINLLRGTGLSGLHGILAKRDRLIRPLLFLNRQKINELVEGHKLDFVEDSSNLSANYTRNKLRLKVIPLLKEINPTLENTFNKNIARFAEIEGFLANNVKILEQKIVRKKEDGIYISLEDILALNPQKLLLFELLKPYGFTDLLVDQILNGLNLQSGKMFFSQSHQAIINREDLIILPVKREAGNQESVYQEIEYIQFNQFHFKHYCVDDLSFETDKNKIYIDFDQLIYPLTIRNWKNGDKFIPMGMSGFKKISDFFIDEKIPLHLKSNVPILVNGNDEIIWVAGMRQDNRYKLLPTTKKVAIFELKI
jgi:tRNA(Ile)-lysidine synthase